MTSKVPFIKQETNWIALVPKLSVIGLLCLCFYQIDKNNFYIIAVFVYFMLTLIARRLFFPAVMYKSIKLIKEGKFGQAIPLIQKTIDYYSKKPWIDKFRFLLLISSSKRTIREGSLCNLGYCYLQIGEIKRAKEIYQNVLAQYPENINAKSTLDTINILTSDNSLV